MNYPLYSYRALVEPHKVIDGEAVCNTLFYHSDASHEEIDEVFLRGDPFAIDLNREIEEVEGLRVIETFERAKTPFALHVLGYTSNNDSIGMLGIEAGYNDYLNEMSGEVYGTGQKLATGELLIHSDIYLTDDNYYSNGGVSLTIDLELQRIVEEELQAIEKGAAVLIENETNKIRAMASTPTYDSTNISAYLHSPDAQFLNRAIEPYNVGSIFKIIVSAVAIEEGETDHIYTCTGNIDVLGQNFGCHNENGHGRIDFETAFKQSCNTYFIDISEKLDYERILEIASALQFDSSYSIAMGIDKKAGVLPSLSSLENERVIANTAIGQGDILASPLDFAMLVRTLTADGLFEIPTLIEGLVDRDGNVIPSINKESPPTRIIDESTANALLELMVKTCESGTGTNAKPINSSAGGKTSSAETGWLIDGERVVHGIFAGFFPADTKKYTLVVLAENGRSGSESANPVFKSIAERILQYETVLD